MKRFSFLMPFAAVAMLFIACDEVKEDERYIEMPVVEAQRAVLIEDFTGQLCMNCPNGHKVIHDLISQYGENAIVPVAIHPGGNANVLDYTPELGNDGLGNTDASQVASVSGLTSKHGMPIGNINRSTGMVGIQDWPAAVRSELEKNTVLNVETDSLTGEGENVKVAIKVIPSENFTGRINVWIVEDGVVGYQMMPDGSDELQYNHNHVFRKCVTSAEGEPVSMQRSIIFEKQYETTLEPLWVRENCKAVIFFTRQDGKVEQAHQVSLKH